MPTIVSQIKGRAGWHMPKPVVIFLILSIIVNTGLITYLFISRTDPLTTIDKRSYARLSSIYWVIDKYGDKNLGKYQKLEVAKAYIALPDDEITLRALSIGALESNYVKNAKSNKNAIGITQFLVATAMPYLRELGHHPRSKEEAEKLLKDPYISAKVCYYHISDLHLVYGNDYKKVLFAYNHASWYVDTVHTLTNTIITEYDSVYLDQATTNNENQRPKKK